MNLKRICPYLFLAAPILVFLAGSSGFPFPALSEYSDVPISHYPNLIFTRYWLAKGIFPLWTDAILSGYPFAANPLSGLWYPPGWALWFLPLPAGINWMVLVHLFWGGVGMYRLLLIHDVKPAPALIGGLAFELAPKCIAHFAAGHMTLVFAVSWTTWLLWAERRAQQRSTWRKTPAVILGLIILADVRWFLYAASVWFFYAWFAYAGESEHPIRWNNLFQAGAMRRWLLWLKTKTIQVIFSVLIGSVVLIPGLEYSRLTTRTSMTLADLQNLALPPGRLLGLVFPDFAGYAEWVVYPGAIVAIGCIAAVFLARSRKKTLFWMILWPFSLLFALGAFPGVSRLPGFDLLRVPTRMYFLAVLASCYLSAAGWEAMSERFDMGIKRLNGYRRILFAITIGILLLAAGVAILSPAMPWEFVWGAIFFTIGAVTSVLITTHREWYKALWGIVFVVLALDLIGVGKMQLTYRGRDETINGDAVKLAKILRQKATEPTRIYSPSYSMPQEVAADYRLELADGIDPMQMRTYVRFMETATGIPTEGYNVTMPPFKNGDPKTANIGTVPDRKKLGVINVGYILSQFEIQGLKDNLQLQIGDTWLYENPYKLPRAWVQDASAPIGTGLISEAAYHPVNANEINVSAKGPGLLVLSEIRYPGWKVYIDQQAVILSEHSDLLRTVLISPGQHNVRFVFRPLSVYLGLSLTAGALILLAVRKFTL